MSWALHNSVPACFEFYNFWTFSDSEESTFFEPQDEEDYNEGDEEEDEEIIKKNQETDKNGTKVRDNDTHVFERHASQVKHIQKERT